MCVCVFIRVCVCDSGCVSDSESVRASVGEKATAKNVEQKFAMIFFCQNVFSFGI